MATTKSTDPNQKIWIQEWVRDELFSDILAAEQEAAQKCYSADEMKHEIKSVLDFYFSAENLERYCVGNTGLADYAYSHIRVLLKKEYAEWKAEQGVPSTQDRIKGMSIAPKIKNCPLCNAPALLSVSEACEARGGFLTSDSASISCTNKECGCTVKKCASSVSEAIKSVIAAWNKRGATGGVICWNTTQQKKM